MENHRDSGEGTLNLLKLWTNSCHGQLKKIMTPPGVSAGKNEIIGNNVRHDAKEKGYGRAILSKMG